MTDFSKINDQIDQLRQTQAEAELKLIAESNARLEKARREAEEKRLDAENRAREASEAQRKKRQEAEEAKRAVQRAEEAHVRTEEMKQNFQLEARQREEEEARVLKEKIENMKFLHEQAMKKLQDEFSRAVTLENSVVTEPHYVNPDGSQLKPVSNNTDGSVNPLDKFRQNVNH